LGSSADALRTNKDHAIRMLLAKRHVVSPDLTGQCLCRGSEVYPQDFFNQTSPVPGILPPERTCRLCDGEEL